MNNVFMRAVLLLAIAAVAGCAGHASQTGTSDPSPATTTPPQSTTDISPSHTPSDSTSRPAADPPPSADSKSPGDSPANGATEQASVRANLNRLFLERPGGEQFAGNAVSPGGVKLLNDKAEHFAQFTRPLLMRLYAATEDYERLKLAQSGVPFNLRPVIIEATMNGDGQLTELVIQQVSGSGAVDQMMILACKKGLWTRNPPPEARMADGNYRMRVEATIQNYMHPTDFADYQLHTHLGLALE